MNTTKTLLLITCSAIALAACSGPDWNEEAGVSLNNVALGEVTLNNKLYQTGQLDYRVELNKRFNTEVQPTINFAFNSAVIDQNAADILRVQATWIKRFPEVRFKVFGHTDAVGSSQSNKRLGQKRANAVVNFLVAEGINRSRLDAAVSFGEERPLVYSSERERLNRRTVTEVTGFVERHPMVLSGKYAEVIAREYFESGTQATESADGGLTVIDSGGQ